jgi:hypothetical protein
MRASLATVLTDESPMSHTASHRRFSPKTAKLLGVNSIFAPFSASWLKRSKLTCELQHIRKTVEWLQRLNRDGSK